jgi:hypothetical protein
MNHGLIPNDTELSGRYRINRPLAQGGMAIVYEATDLQLHREVAIKVLDSLPAMKTFEPSSQLRRALPRP